MLAGQEAVLSALGAPAGREPVTLYSQGTGAILAAMAEHSVRRIACVSAGGTKQGVDPNNPWFFEHVITPLLLARIFDDMCRMEELLMRSDTAWTILRPPQLLNTPATGRYRVAQAYSLPGGRQIARADLADLMLDAVEQGRHIGEAVAVAY
jgi:putative NADH-flavin reductase